MFGFDIKDTTPPVIYGLFGYPLSENSHIRGNTKRVEIRIIKQKDGTYKVFVEMARDKKTYENILEIIGGVKNLTLGRQL